MFMLISYMLFFQSSAESKVSAHGKGSAINFSGYALAFYLWWHLLVFPDPLHNLKKFYLWSNHFSNSSSKFMLSIWYPPGTALCVSKPVTNKTESLPHGPLFCWGVGRGSIMNSIVCWIMKRLWGKIG